MSHHHWHKAVRRLAGDLPGLWDSPTTTVVDRKEILRQVVDRVVVNVVGASERVMLVIHWAGGTQTEHEMVRPVASLEQLSYWPQLADRFAALASQNLSVRQIAIQLNAEGWRPPKRRERFGAQGVQSIMNRLGLSERRSRSKDRTGLEASEWWIPSLARALDMPAVTVYHWLSRGWLKARRTDRGRWVIWADAAEVKRLGRLRSLPRGHHTRRNWIEPGKVTSSN